MQHARGMQRTHTGCNALHGTRDAAHSHGSRSYSGATSRALTWRSPAALAHTYSALQRLCAPRGRATTPSTAHGRHALHGTRPPRPPRHTAATPSTAHGRQASRPRLPRRLCYVNRPSISIGRQASRPRLPCVRAPTVHECGESRRVTLPWHVAASCMPHDATWCHAPREATGAAARRASYAAMTPVEAGSLSPSLPLSPTLSLSPRFMRRALHRRACASRGS
jgi:hypothetical protein